MDTRNMDKETREGLTEARKGAQGSLAVKCPECGAAPGFACRSDRARNDLGVLKRDHSARREAAKAAAATTTTEATAN